MLDKHKAEWFKAATITEYSEKSKAFSKMAYGSIISKQQNTNY